ncbi:MAG: hypothetical protein WAQ28_18515 [Bacteroidia bacterium]
MMNAAFIIESKKSMQYVVLAMLANPLLSAYVIVILCEEGFVPDNPFCRYVIAAYLYTVPVLLNFLSYKYYTKIIQWNLLKVLLMLMGTINLFSIIAWILIGPLLLFIMGCDRWTID